jgi:tetratricopeptide (TPR) repeat protein
LVETIEALAPDRGGEQVERLAHHALRGEIWDKAVTYCQQAGARASGRAAFHEAVASFEHALQALAHLPESSDTRGLAIDLRLALGDALPPLGEYERCLALLVEAETLARGLDDQARLGRVLAWMALVRRITGDLDGALAASQQALDLATALGDRALQVEAVHHLGTTYYGIGDFSRAAELLRRNVEAANGQSGTPSRNVRLLSQVFLALTLGTLGVFPESRRYGEEALRLATLEGRGATPTLVHAFLSHLYLGQGDLEHAIRIYD